MCYGAAEIIIIIIIIIKLLYLYKYLAQIHAQSVCIACKTYNDTTQLTAATTDKMSN